jgi:hypothetical protein
LFSRVFYCTVHFRENFRFLENFVRFLRSEICEISRKLANFCIFAKMDKSIVASAIDATLNYLISYQFILGFKKIYWLIKIGNIPVSVKFFCPQFPSSKDIKVYRYKSFLNGHSHENDFEIITFNQCFRPALIVCGSIVDPNPDIRILVNLNNFPSDFSHIKHF